MQCSWTLLDCWIVCSLCLSTSVPARTPELGAVQVRMWVLVEGEAVPLQFQVHCQEEMDWAISCGCVSLSKPQMASWPICRKYLQLQSWAEQFGWLRCCLKRRLLGQGPWCMWFCSLIFVQEFPALDRDYYERALQQGRLTVEDTRRGRSWKGGPLEDGQCIRHFIHRHEPPTLDELPQVRKTLLLSQNSLVI